MHIASLQHSLKAFGKWSAFIAGICVMLCGGTCFVLSFLAYNLKEILKLTQYEINFIGTMSNVGALVAFAPALFHDKFGPRLTSVLGGALMSFGFFMTYLATVHAVRSPYWLIGVYMMTHSAGSSACFTAALNTNVANFPKERLGLVVGFMSCVFGISGAVFSVLYDLFGQHTSAYLLFLTILCGAGPILGFLFLHKFKQEMPTEQVEESVKEFDASTQSTSSSESPSTESEQYFDDNETTVGLTPLQTMKTGDFWIFMFCGFCGSSGIAITNNLGSVVDSYGGDPTIVPLLFTLYSIGLSTGKFTIGYLSDRLALYATRATFYNFGALLQILCAVSFATFPVSTFYVLVFILGVSNGAGASMMYAFMSQRFGNLYFGTNCTITYIGSSASSYIFATWLASSIYEANITGEGKMCHGMKCFQATFLIVTIVCVIGFISGLVLMYRVRNINKPKIKKIIV